MRKNIVLFIAFVLTGCNSSEWIDKKIESAVPSAPHFDEILYGCAYYHEYMPYERLQRDMKMMKECGINVIRIGESTWGLYEPQEGEFHFEWFDRVLDAAHQWGIKVIVGTPTYAIPQWMAKKHPDILVKTFHEQAEYGGRQNMDITNKKYLFYAERIIRKQVQRAAMHPAVIGFQVDNETKSYATASESAKKLFLEYLKEKFKTPDSLNKAWTLNYWSHNIARWDDFNVAGQWANNAYWLEWNRFQRKLSRDFLAWQASIVRQYKRPDQFITQNFDLYWRNDQSTGPQPEVDHWGAARFMDIAGIDIYHRVQDDQDGSVIAFAGDYTRSLKMTNYLVLETQAQAKGGSSVNQQVIYDGQLRQNVYAHLACGANMVAYWPWHSIHNSAETFWKGLLSHDMDTNRVFNEACRTAHELKKIGKKLVNLRKKNKVAILYSQDSFNALLMKPFSTRINYADVINELHACLYKLNIEVDFIVPDKPALSNYEVVIIPPLYISSDSLLQAIDEYVQKGGTALICFKSGFCNMNSAVRPVVMPGLLRKACGIKYQEFCNIDKIPLQTTFPVPVNGESYACEWVELLLVETATPVAFYRHPFYRRYPAVTENKYGTGKVYYQGTVLSPAAQTALFEKIFTEKRMLDKSSLRFPVIVRNGTNDEGKQIRYIFNYSDKPTKIRYPFNEGTDLLSTKKINKNEELALEPWGIAIIEEK